MPLGNLTSQLFVFFSRKHDCLERQIPNISSFLMSELRLTLHPDKLYIKTLASGVDFLGWVHFPDHRVLRTTTKRRMFKNLRRSGGKPKAVQSYLGLLGHGNTEKLTEEITREFAYHSQICTMPVSPPSRFLFFQDFS